MPAADLAALIPDPPPDLAFTPRTGTRSVAAVRSAVAALPAAGPAREALTALALLWHDHEPEAHAICQAHEGEADFDYVHAILHRREGDVGNAGWWLDRIGVHPVHQRLGPAAAALDLDCTRDGRFQPRLFLDLVAAHAGAAPTGGELDHGRWRADLVSLQATELRELARHLLGEDPRARAGGMPHPPTQRFGR